MRKVFTITQEMEIEYQDEKVLADVASRLYTDSQPYLEIFSTTFGYELRSGQVIEVNGLEEKIKLCPNGMKYYQGIHYDTCFTCKIKPCYFHAKKVKDETNN